MSASEVIIFLMLYFLSVFLKEKETGPYVSIRKNIISHTLFFCACVISGRSIILNIPYSISVDINIYWGFEMFLIYWLLAHVFGDKIIFWIFSLSALILRLFLFNQYNGFGEKIIFWIICSSISVYIEVSQGGYLLLFLAMNVFNFLDDIKQLYNRSLWIFCPSALTLRCHRACLSICQRLRTKPPVYNWTVKVLITEQKAMKSESFDSFSQCCESESVCQSVRGYTRNLLSTTG